MAVEKHDGVESLESSLRNPLSYDAIDQMMQTISKKSGISPKQLRDKFMKKHGKTPDTYAKSISESKELKRGQTVYVTKEHPKLSNTPTSGRIHSVGDTHVVLKTTGGSGLYKVHKDNLSHDSKDNWMSQKYRKEEAPVNAVGGGNIAGMGVDKPGKPGSGEPGVYRKKKKDLVLDPMAKRKTLTDFLKGK